jgi:hypothetical protein
MAALDKDKDGSLSADEITAAAESLKTLDKNGDGKLAEDELRPPRPPRGPGGPEGFGRGPRGDAPFDGPPPGERGPRARRRGDDPFGPDGPPPEDFQRGPRDGGPPDGPPGDRGPRRGPPEGFREDFGRGPRVLPPGAREHLDLTEEQAKEIDALEADVKSRLEKILKPEQFERLGEMFRRGPGGPGRGRGDRRFEGPPDGPPGPPDRPRPPRPPRDDAPADRPRDE